MHDDHGPVRGEAVVRQVQLSCCRKRERERERERHRMSRAVSSVVSISGLCTKALRCFFSQPPALLLAVGFRILLGAFEEGHRCQISLPGSHKARAGICRSLSLHALQRGCRHEFRLLLPGCQVLYFFCRSRRAVQLQDLQFDSCAASRSPILQPGFRV